MKKNLLQFLLLFSLFFNIAHAGIIAENDSCAHETAHEYAMEQSQPSDCGDLCDLHHLFHFTAIIETPLFVFSPLKAVDTFTQKATLYTSTFPKTNIKPPIA